MYAHIHGHDGRDALFCLPIIVHLQSHCTSPWPSRSCITHPLSRWLQLQLSSLLVLYLLFFFSHYRFICFTSSRRWWSPWQFALLSPGLLLPSFLSFCCPYTHTNKFVSFLASYSIGNMCSVYICSLHCLSYSWLGRLSAAHTVVNTRNHSCTLAKAHTPLIVHMSILLLTAY